MGNTQFYIQKGQIITATKDKPANGLFNLNKLFKKFADWFHVPWVDDCCDADTTNLPVRYNHDTSKIQYYNPTTKVWTNLTTF